MTLPVNRSGFSQLGLANFSPASTTDLLNNSTSAGLPDGFDPSSLSPSDLQALLSAGGAGYSQLQAFAQANGVTPQSVTQFLAQQASTARDLGGQGINFVANTPGMGKPMTRGDQGPQIQALQEALMAMGYITQDEINTGPGIFGPKTERAVRAFQRDTGIPETGKVGLLTESAIAGLLPLKVAVGQGSSMADLQNALPGMLSGMTTGGLAGTPPGGSIPGAEGAIAWAENPGPNPFAPTWSGWCLALVSQAYQHGGGRTIPNLAAGTATGAYNNYASQGLIHSDKNPPRGAVVFYSWVNPSNGEDQGHVGISLGNGQIVSSLGNTPIDISWLGYRGWAYP